MDQEETWRRNPWVQILGTKSSDVGEVGLKGHSTILEEHGRGYLAKHRRIRRDRRVFTGRILIEAREG